MDRATLDRYFQKRVRPAEEGSSEEGPQGTCCDPADVTTGRHGDGNTTEDREQDGNGAGSHAREAPGGSSAVGEAKQEQGKGNLEAYFEKRAKMKARPLRRKKGCIVSPGLAEYETRGRLAPDLTHRCLQESLRSLRPSWTSVRLANSGQAGIPSPWDSDQFASTIINSRNDYVSSMEFSQDGSRLLCAHASGTLAVYPAHHPPDKVLRGHETDEDNHFEAVAGWQADINRLIERAAFSPRHPDKVVCVGSSSDCVRIFDLNLPANAQLRGQQVLRGGSKPALAPGRKRTGYSDCVAMPCSSPISMAAVSCSAVHAWDVRASSSRPAMQFHGPRLNAGASAGFKCIEQSCGGQALHVGTEGGMVHTWDVRGGGGAQRGPHSPGAPLLPTNSSSAFTFCNQAPSTPPVSSLSLPYELQRAQETRLPVREVQSLCVNPSNGQQMAVALEGGVTGVVDLLSGQLTHASVPGWLCPEEVVAPADARVLITESSVEEAMRSGLFVQRPRRCAWLRSPAAECLVAPNASHYLQFLDVRRGSSIGAQHRADLSQRKMSAPIDDGRVLILPSTLQAIAGRPPICAAVHPTQELIALGMEGRTWAFLHPKLGGACDDSL